LYIYHYIVSNESREVGNATLRRASVLVPDGWSCIYSREHGLISLGLGILFGLVHPDPTATGLSRLAVIGYAVVVGVGIDFDHFLIERLLHGEWRGVRRAIDRPRRVLLDQSDLFEDGTISSLDRLLSHVVIIGIVVPATWLVAPALGLLTVLVLYGHVLSDLVWDVYRRRVADGPPHAEDLN
jgi:hypothetical protein